MASAHKYPEAEFVRDLAALIDAPRSFTVASETSYIGGKHTVFHLRCFGRGISSIGEGKRSTFPSEAVAEAYGQAWIKTGIDPCYQTPLGVSLVSA